MTIKEMFNYLKQYIDKRINGLSDSIKSIFDEYGVKEVSNNIEDVRNYGKTYLGPKSEEPTTRNDGEPLQVGDLYFDESLKVMKAYDGEKWQITQQYSDEDILNKLKNVDGAGSGLDSDLVRGGEPVKLDIVGAAIVKTDNSFIKNQITAWAKIANDATIIDSYNISSVTHDDTGIYTFYFEQKMDNTNYIVVATANEQTSNNRISTYGTIATDKVSIRILNKDDVTGNSMIGIIFVGGR